MLVDEHARNPTLGPAAKTQATSSKCVVCKRAEFERAFVPCGHACVCKGCADAIMADGSTKACPTCRTSAVEVSSLAGVPAEAALGEGADRGASSSGARAHDGDANAVSVSMNGNFVVSGGCDGRIKLWY